MKKRSHRSLSVYGANSGGAVWRTDRRLSWETRLGQRIVPMPNGCWAMDGNLDKYGTFHEAGYAGSERAHRIVYEVLVGPLDPDDVLHHECRNKGCVNPEHLTPMSPGDHSRLHAAEGRPTKKAS